MRYLIPLLFISLGSFASADPRTDLESPLQEVRDNAAKHLRDTYQPPPREKWDKLAQFLKSGDPEGKVLGLFHPQDKNGGQVMHDWVHYWYRLDDAWLLQCEFEARIDAQAPMGGLVRWFVMPGINHVRVAPPEDFTGLWKTYYINGQPFCVQQFKNGKAVKTTYYELDRKLRP